MSDALVITDSAGGLLWCNGRFEQLLQPPRLRLLGSRLDQLLQSRFAGDFTLNLHDLLEQRPHGGLVTLVLEREPLQVIELEWLPVQSEQPAPYVFSVHDVSDRESLQALQLQSRLLVDEQLALAQQVGDLPRDRPAQPARFRPGDAGSPPAPRASPHLAGGVVLRS
ncbi:MAG: PAS domain-containing protein [Cyanobium sp.]